MSKKHQRKEMLGFVEAYKNFVEKLYAEKCPYKKEAFEKILRYIEICIKVRLDNE